MTDINPSVLVIIGALGMWILNLLQDHFSQKKLFDHRLRLEKEYGLYSALWDKLFELRRAVGQLVELLGSTDEVRHDKDLPDLFNAYQQVVRKGEPFMSTSVYDPAREVVTLAQKIICNESKHVSIHKHREKGLNSEADEKCANKEIRLDEESEAAFKSIEGLYKEIAKAIRVRVTP